MFALTFLEAMEAVLYCGWLAVGEDFAPMTYLRCSDGLVEVVSGKDGENKYPFMVTTGTLNQKYAIVTNALYVKNLK